MHRVLVLNATYEPLSTVSVQRAIVLLLKEKAELVESAAERLHAVCTSLPVPLVIRLVYYVRIPHPVVLSPTRKSVALRDNYTCQYCGAAPGRALLTLDHILPRSRGGQTTWDNVVAACRACNMRKGNRTPEEAGLVLRKHPGRPHYLAFLLLSEAGPPRRVEQVRVRGELKQEEERGFTPVPPPVRRRSIYPLYRGDATAPCLVLRSSISITSSVVGWRKKVLVRA